MFWKFGLEKLQSSDFYFVENVYFWAFWPTNLKNPEFGFRIESDLVEQIKVLPVRAFQRQWIRQIFEFCKFSFE